MIQVGFGVGDVTPKPGMEMPGGFSKRLGSGVLDPLQATACVIHDGKTSIALVGLDAVAIERESVDEARALIAKQTKIPGANVLIGANHSHSAGPTVSVAGGDRDDVYLDMLAKGIAKAVTDGWNSLHPAKLAAEVGKAEGIAYNRRFLMRNGREITHPGKPGTPRHAEIVSPAGPADHDVGVLAFQAPDGKIAGVVVNFACHSTVVGGSQYSPDYAGYLRKHIKAIYGENVGVVFLLGACGDITQVDNMSRAREFGPDYADMIGRRLAAETERVIRRATWIEDETLASSTEVVPIAIRPDPDVDRERPEFGLGSDKSWEPVYAKERALIAEERKRRPLLSCEVQALRIGPLGIATNGAEYFCEYGLRIKQASPFKTTYFVSLANEYIGYVPTAQAFVGGGYEPRTARSSKLAIDAGQKLVEAALTALGKVAPKA